MRSLASRVEAPSPSRWFPSAALGALLALALGAPPARALDEQPDTIAAVQAVSPSVVTVWVLFSNDPKKRGIEDLASAVRIVRPGSGTVVSADGLVLTNAHLVAEAVQADGSPAEDHWVVVTLESGGRYVAEVVATDERTDLALLRVRTGERLQPLPLGAPRELPAGEPVLALSFAGGEANNVFAGVLAFPGGPTRLREAELATDEVVLSDARFHHTLDGGPLVDLRGRLLGVHNSSHVPPPRAPFTEPDEEEKEESEPEDTDYAVIVSADAVRAAFGERLPGDLPPALVSPDDPREVVDAVAAAEPSVVSVWAGEGEHPATPDPTDPFSRRAPEGLGSGVVIGAGGVVLSSSLLFAEDATRASVRLASGETFEARLLARAPERKAALLQLELPEGASVPAATLADSRSAIAGEPIAVVGRPYSTKTLSAGVLSALEREGFVQVATWVHRGHLGGALVDVRGRLLGIAVDQPASAGRVGESSYLGFAAPLATLFEDFASELEPRGLALPPADDAAAAEARRGPAAQVVERTRASLVNVLVSKAVPVEPSGFNPFGDPEPVYALLGQGSGVVVDASGLAITNWHVIDAAVKPGAEANHRVEVTMPTGDRYLATVLSHSRDDDLALISLALEPGQSVVPVELGDSDALEVGQPVFAIGNPLGLANSVSAGIVSCKALDVQIQGRLREYKGLLMTDAAINPGNSGGALLDAEARLVGINSAGRVGAGMAIPVNKAREVFSDKLLSAERLRSASFGFRVAARDGALVVTEVDADGPADGLDLQAGDTLLAVDGRALTGAIGFAQAQRDARPGEPVRLRLARHGEERELELEPVSYAAWRAFRQSGALVRELDYAAETERVHAAAIALYRAYTGDRDGRPATLMSGALRVERVRSLVEGIPHPLRPGDLLLGVTTYVRGATTDNEHLTRLEGLDDLAAAFDQRATKEGQWAQCWLLRDGEILSERVWVRRPTP